MRGKGKYGHQQCACCFLSVRFPVAISFTPTQEGLVTFNLCMVIKGKVQPLTMSVKADGYNMNVCVQYESPEGVRTELSASDCHLVDFKQVSYDISYEKACLSESSLYVTLKM